MTRFQIAEKDSTIKLPEVTVVAKIPGYFIEWSQGGYNPIFNATLQGQPDHASKLAPAWAKRAPRIRSKPDSWEDGFIHHSWN